MVQLPGKLNSNDININTLPLKSIAHLGDAVYELYIRKKTIFLTPKIDKLHRLTTSLVNASFHADVVNYLTPYLSEDELSLLKRARNLSLTSSKRRDQSIHRLSTSLEALIGYLYLSDYKRLEELFAIIDEYIDRTINTNRD